jgi:hypothetical protein
LDGVSVPLVPLQVKSLPLDAPVVDAGPDPPADDGDTALAPPADDDAALDAGVVAPVPPDPELLLQAAVTSTPAAATATSISRNVRTCPPDVVIARNGPRLLDVGMLSRCTVRPIVVMIGRDTDHRRMRIMRLRAWDRR